MSEHAADQSATGGSLTRPAVRIERGNPSAEDIAALVAILAASAEGEDGSAEAARLLGWAARTPRMRTPHPRGPGAWRSSAHTR